MATVRIKALTMGGAIDIERNAQPLRADHVNKSLSPPSLDRKGYALTIGLRRFGATRWRGNGAGVASSVTVIVAKNLGRSASNRRTVVLTFTWEPRGKAKSSASWWAAAIKACGRSRKPRRQSTCCQRHAKSIAYRLRGEQLSQGAVVSGAQKPRAALGLPRMLLARGAHTNTTDHRVSLSRKPNSGTGVEKDRCRAIWKNRTTRQS
jgi:hypothetical protein